jgi:hypothetical protein
LRNLNKSTTEHYCNTRKGFPKLSFTAFLPAPIRHGSSASPKLSWDESVKRDLKEWNISKDLAMDRSAWRLTINVPEP